MIIKGCTYSRYKWFFTVVFFFFLPFTFICNHLKKKISLVAFYTCMLLVCLLAAMYIQLYCIFIRSQLDNPIKINMYFVFSFIFISIFFFVNKHFSKLKEICCLRLEENKKFVRTDLFRIFLFFFFFSKLMSTLLILFWYSSQPQKQTEKQGLKWNETIYF